MVCWKLINILTLARFWMISWFRFSFLKYFWSKQTHGHTMDKTRCQSRTSKIITCNLIVKRASSWRDKPSERKQPLKVGSAACCYEKKERKKNKNFTFFLPPFNFDLKSKWSLDENPIFGTTQNYSIDLIRLKLTSNQTNIPRFFFVVVVVQYEIMGSKLEDITSTAPVHLKITMMQFKWDTWILF